MLHFCALARDENCIMVSPIKYFFQVYYWMKSTLWGYWSRILAYFVYLFQYSDGSIDTEAQSFLNKLKNETVPGVLHSSNIKDFTVSWGPGITLELHADYLR